jgi:DNA-binding MarR family transcriptional regulator
MTLLDEAGFLLSRASGRLVQTTNEALAPFGLRVRQYSVLALACDSGEGISQRELAATLGLDPSQVVALVDELQRAGLVERRTASNDRRARLVVGTRAGRARRTAAARATAAAEDAALDILTGRQREQLRRSLRRLLDG